MLESEYMKGPIKYIVVTGATGGIGMCIVRKAIQNGYVVIATSHKKTGLMKIKKEFGKNNIITYQLNLENPRTFQNFTKFVKKIGSIQWLINAAGYIDMNESPHSSKYSEMRKTFLINTESTIILIYEMLPLIKGKGGVINISSTASIWGNSQYPIYSASKAALNVFSRSLAKSFEKTALQMLTICPGPTNTPMREKLAKDSINHQDPSIIGEAILQFILKKTDYKNGDVVIIRDGRESLYSSLTD